MLNYEDKIEKCLSYLKRPSRLTPTGSNPIAYLTYEPKDAFVMRELARTFLKSKAEYHGVHPHFVSMGEWVDEFINHVDFFIKETWCDESIDENMLYTSIRQEFESSQFLENKLLEIQEEYADDPDTLFIIKDVEMLHPFMMMGVIENKIYNKIKLPIIVLYPGTNQGIARSFLNIYPQDGTYRSKNF